jgi:hypothetical protein
LQCRHIRPRAAAKLKQKKATKEGQREKRVSVVRKKERKRKKSERREKEEKREEREKERKREASHSENSAARAKHFCCGCGGSSRCPPRPTSLSRNFAKK